MAYKKTASNGSTTTISAELISAIAIAVTTAVAPFFAQGNNVATGKNKTTTTAKPTKRGKSTKTASKGSKWGKKDDEKLARDFEEARKVSQPSRIFKVVLSKKDGEKLDKNGKVKLTFKNSDINASVQKTGNQYVIGFAKTKDVCPATVTRSEREFSYFKAHRA